MIYANSLSLTHMRTALDKLIEARAAGNHDLILTMLTAPDEYGRNILE